jgi:hypothetical protein
MVQPEGCTIWLAIWSDPVELELPLRMAVVA